jgi:hypothetical protein
MKLIIAGSRSFINAPISLIDDALQCIDEHLINLHTGQYLPITEIVSGMAPGIDLLGLLWANQVQKTYSFINVHTNNTGNGVVIDPIPTASFPAEWHKYGTAAGPIRNAKMANYADALLAIHDNMSPGTNHMFNLMIRLHKPTFVYSPVDNPKTPWILDAFNTESLPILTPERQTL